MLTFISSPNWAQTVIQGAPAYPAAMSIPLLILAVGSIIVGYLFKDMVIGIGTTFYDQAIIVLPRHISLISAEFMSPLIK